MSRTTSTDHIDHSYPNRQTIGIECAEPSRIGRRRFLLGAGAAAGAALTATLPDSPALAAVPAGASRFVALDSAARLADTRDPKRYPFRRVAPTRINVTVAGRAGVPPQATAAVLTVTAVNGGEPNFVTVFPAGISIPDASNLNLVEPGAVNANLVTVKIGNDGSVDVFSRRGAALIVDVLGYYLPTAGRVRAGRFVALSSARRSIDTRPRFAAGFEVVDITGAVPADAASVVVNLTATETTAPSFFTAVAVTKTGKPETSSLNVTGGGQTRAAGVIVPVTTVRGRRRIAVFSLAPAKLVVDVTGYFTSETSPSSDVGLFVPVDPRRLLDTRNPGEIGRLWPRWVVEAKLPAFAAKASAVIVNITGVATRGPGYLTVSAARQPIPGTSNVNFTAPDQVVPNHVITPVTATHGIQIYSSHGAHVIADLAGYFTGNPKSPTVAAYNNPPPPPAPPAWTLRVPRLGLTSTVLPGDPKAVTDAGHSWLWTGTGYVGQHNAHVALFAHRTEAGAPYYLIDQLQVGDQFTVTTGDLREYTYRMVRRDLTDAATKNILDATRAHSGTTMSLVACTVGHDRSKARWPDVWAPTSLLFRIVVTAEYVSWRQL